MRLSLHPLAFALAVLAGGAACTGAPPDGAPAESAAAGEPAPGEIIGYDSVLGPGDTTGVRELPPGTLSRDTVGRDTVDRDTVHRDSTPGPGSARRP